MSVELVPSVRAPPVARPRRVLAGVLAGGGVLAVVTAGFLLELGTRGGPDHPDDKYRYAGATPAGAVIGIVGVAAITTGIYLWWHGPVSGAVTAGSGTSVRSTGNTLVAGWATAF